MNNNFLGSGGLQVTHMDALKPFNSKCQIVDPQMKTGGHEEKLNMAISGSAR